MKNFDNKFGNLYDEKCSDCKSYINKKGCTECDDNYSNWIKNHEIEEIENMTKISKKDMQEPFTI